jgi:hypothetical protein
MIYSLCGRAEMSLDRHIVASLGVAIVTRIVSARNLEMNTVASHKDYAGRP